MCLMQYNLEPHKKIFLPFLVSRKSGPRWTVSGPWKHSDMVLEAIFVAGGVTPGAGKHVNTADMQQKYDRSSHLGAMLEFGNDSLCEKCKKKSKKWIKLM